MSISPIELDFFSIERERERERERRDSFAASKPPILERKRSFHGIQSIVSKLNPEIVKTVIQSASLDLNKSLRVENHNSISPFTLDTPTFRPSYGEKNNAETEEMTIVFNGKVFHFDLFSTHKVQNILKLAYEEQVTKSAQSLESKVSEILLEQDLLATLDRGFPLARRKSLLRFLDKRKERLI
ncbi:Protein TIFY 9 [Forsythia ovata]|uniref:Protein TIFY n=1 Tax=Forsythia ovata TaxID=205694 RepID=A0ABD1XDF7_9LAMI